MAVSPEGYGKKGFGSGSSFGQIRWASRLGATRPQRDEGRYCAAPWPSGRGFVAGKVSPVLEHIAQLHVQTFNGVGRIDDFSDLGRIGEKGSHLLPYPSPALHRWPDFEVGRPPSGTSERFL